MSLIAWTDAELQRFTNLVDDHSPEAIAKKMEKSANEVRRFYVRYMAALPPEDRPPNTRLTDVTVARPSRKRATAGRIIHNPVIFEQIAVAFQPYINVRQSIAQNPEVRFSLSSDA